MAIGIYKITNLINEKVYIGQSWNIESRWSHHKTVPSNNAHLRAAIEKYGLHNFSFEILREFRVSSLTQIFLDIFEKQFAKIYDSHNPEKGYNLKECGSGGRLAEETKQKIRESTKAFWQAHGPRERTLEHTEKIRQAKIGCTLSESTKQKMSVAAIGRPKSETARNKMSAYSKNRSPEHATKIRKALTGRIVSEETRKRLSEAHKRKAEVTR